ncbi:MAG: hypothetical protein KF724_04385 [Phycisphaeraceae bacterium]|nr:hypothetical protein [Phycisphaeraceae bacterium]
MRWSAPAGLLLLVATVTLLATRSPMGAEVTLLQFAGALIEDLWAPLLWMVSALGWGTLVCRALMRSTLGGERREAVTERPFIRFDWSSSAQWALSSAVGVALLLFVAQVAGSLGLLRWPVVAWALLLPGVGVACGGLVSHLRERMPHAARKFASPASGIGWWPMAPAIGVLVFAATSSPGHLWSTEFGGYDALSYHLALPRDWRDFGAMTPIATNAYAYLPSWIEGGFLHLFALGGDSTLMGLRAQLLHALITLVTARCGAEVARGVARAFIDSARADRDALASLAALIAATVTLATPWVIVTGSMAYNEMGAALGGVALLLVCGAPLSLRSRGALLGVCGALMVGSKLSAGVLLLPAVAVLVLVGADWRRHQSALGALMTMLMSAGVAALIALLLCAPWLLRNWIATGNPLFPFASGLLGAGAWSADQIEVWQRAHGAEGSPGERLLALWRQFFIFGLGSAPVSGEPWRPFWGVLPWLVAPALLTLAWSRDTRRLAAAFATGLAFALIAWMTFTHLQSRFLVPLAPIAAATVALGVVRVVGASRTDQRTDGRSPLRLIAALPLLLVSLQPVAAFWSEGENAALMIGAERAMTGDERAAFPPAIAATAPKSRAFVLNFEIAPRARALEQRVLLIGDAATFRYRAPHQSSTVWTRDPLVEALTAERDGSAIVDRLREARIGWVLVDHGMMSIWRRSGWLAATLDEESVARIEAPLRPIMEFPGGARLFEVPPPSRPPAVIR